MPHFPKEAPEITWTVDRENLSTHSWLTDGSDTDRCVPLCVRVFGVFCVSLGLQY